LFDKIKNKDPYKIYSTLIGATLDDRQLQTAPIFGLEIAFPFWDRKVQKYINALPRHYKYRKNETKVLFKEVLKNNIPSHIWERPKHSFDYPFDRLLRHNNCEILKKYLAKDALNDHLLFIPFIVEEYVKKFKDGDSTVKFKIWSLIVFQAWYYNYYKSL
jgi:asparagine synthase (glutamine-hydrolysing)